MGGGGEWPLDTWKMTLNVEEPRTHGQDWRKERKIDGLPMTVDAVFKEFYYKIKIECCVIKWEVLTN